jgi:methionyl-tRNA formyltransferase
LLLLFAFIFGANLKSMRGKELRIVFMGTPDFAVASLNQLVVNGYNVVGVITVPDKPAGRGQKLSESAVKQYAVQNGLKVLQPEKLKDPDFLSELKSLEADLQVVVAFRMLPVEVWDMPRLGTFNLHASLLPKYRGAAPLNWAIINGDEESGVTTFKLLHEIDTGNIIFQEKVAIGEDDNVEVLHDKLMDVGSELVLKTVDALADGNVEMIPQDELIRRGNLPCHAPKIFKDDCLIDWTKDAATIKNFVRGLSPYPSAWTKFFEINSESESSIKIFEVKVEISDAVIEPGKVYSDGKTYFKIGCNNGFVHVLDLQLAGKKRMPVADFLRGFSDILKYKCL